MPLQDEVDHVEFGLSRLYDELVKLPLAKSTAYLKNIELRLDFLDDTLHDMGIDVHGMFAVIGADYQKVVVIVML